MASVNTTHHPPRHLSCKISQNNKGVTLVEILLVVLILSIVTVLVIPSSQPLDNQKLKLAASEVAEAIRFARSESMRTGQTYGISALHLAEQVKVYLANMLTDPPSISAMSYHPMDKKIYEFNLEVDAATQGVLIANTTDIFNYTGLGTAQQELYFDEKGSPFFEDSTGRYQLNNGSIQLSYSGMQMTVSVAPVTGRVTIIE